MKIRRAANAIASITISAVIGFLCITGGTFPGQRPTNNTHLNAHASITAGMFVETARSYIGYGPDEVIDFFGGSYFPWCAAFASFIAEKTGAQDIVPRSTFVSISFPAMPSFEDYYRSRGLWHDPEGYTPKYGDFIFYQYDGNRNIEYDHIGLVDYAAYSESWDTTVVYTIEGNVNDTVAYRTHSIYDNIIVGYASPLWDDADLSFTLPEEAYSSTDTYSDGISYSSTQDDNTQFFSWSDEPVTTPPTQNYWYNEHPLSHGNAPVQEYTAVTEIVVVTEIVTVPTTAVSTQTTTAEASTTSAASSTAVPAVTTTETAPLSPAPVISLGDIDHDGLVTALDSTIVLAQYASLSTGGDSEISLDIADINSDGQINGDDAILILEYYTFYSTSSTVSDTNYLTIDTFAEIRGMK